MTSQGALTLPLGLVATPRQGARKRRSGQSLTFSFLLKPILMLFLYYTNNITKYETVFKTESPGAFFLRNQPLHCPAFELFHLFVSVIFPISNNITQYKTSLYYVVLNVTEKGSKTAVRRRDLNPLQLQRQARSCFIQSFGIIKSNYCKFSHLNNTRTAPSVTPISFQSFRVYFSR